MATSNTNTSVNSLSDLANWVDTQLSIIIDGASSGYSLGNHNSVWIDKGDTVFTVSLGDGTEVTIDSGNFNTAEEIAAAILATIPVTPNTPATMNPRITFALKVAAQFLAVAAIFLALYCVLWAGYYLGLPM